ncbi:MAG: riboflavin synthase [bacterium]
MFTGIVQEVGILSNLLRQGSSAQAVITAPRISVEAALGDSICVNGTCLTVTRREGERFTADLSSETLQRTTFAFARIGDWVNVEPALRPMDRLGGHIVSGHVDDIGYIEDIREEGEFWRLGVRFPARLAPYIAEKGSLAVEGISLTVAAVAGDAAEFAVIPFTLQNTNLRAKRTGDPVNLEVDLLARYVERLLAAGPAGHGGGLTVEKLRKYGYLQE